MTNIFAQILAQSKRNTEPEVNPSLYLEQRSSNHPPASYALLVEKNFALENQVSELQSTRIEADTGLTVREKKCDEKLQKFNHAAQLYNERKQEHTEVVQSALRSTEIAEDKQNALLEKFEDLYQRHITVVQNYQKFMQRVVCCPNCGQTVDQKLSYKQQTASRIASSKKPSQRNNLPTQEEYSMSPQNDNQPNPMPAPKISPFGYANQVATNIYTRSMPPNFSHPNNTDNDRMAQLEKQVEKLTSIVNKLVERANIEKPQTRDTKVLDQFIQLNS